MEGHNAIEFQLPTVTYNNFKIYIESSKKQQVDRASQKEAPHHLTADD